MLKKVETPEKVAARRASTMLDAILARDKERDRVRKETGAVEAAHEPATKRVRIIGESPAPGRGKGKGRGRGRPRKVDPGGA